MEINKTYIQNYLKQHHLDNPDGIIPLSSYSESVQKHYESLSMDILKRNFGGKISTFIPGKQFVSLSVTGSSCELNCEHCHSHYLSHMQDVSSEDKLRKSLNYLIERNANGCLISGGCDSDGKVPLLRFFSTLKEFKQKSSLIFNFHVGLVNEEDIRKIAEIQPDFVSFDLTLDAEIIHDVYHLKKHVNDYISTYKTLIQYGVRTIPHICVGLNFGDIKNEILALHKIANHPVDLIVFLVIIPPLEHPKFHEVKMDDIRNLFTTARLLFPQTEISLGCMRPRGAHRHQIEALAVHAGFNRYEIPSRKTLALIQKKNLSIQTFNTCCAISHTAMNQLSKS
ncbi:MAG: hypothetical protein JW776_05790 [Candidatus Lokiarchaeota archaeon]|nr:hypothetical protein [Candidatus Lokiarchaeota archaeon]